MNIKTTFSIGDKVWCTCGGDPKQLTVGQIRVVVTDTPGLDLGDGIPWDNFKAKKEFVEELMCVESGIGSGSVYTVGKHAFANEFECRAKVEAYEKEMAQ